MHRSRPVSTFQTTAGNNDHINNVFANINFKHSFDSTGKEITAMWIMVLLKSNSISYNGTKYY